MAQTVVDEIALREPRLLVRGLGPMGPVRVSDKALKTLAAMVAVTRSKSQADSRNLVDGRIGFTTAASNVGSSAVNNGVLSVANYYYHPAWWLGGKELVTTGAFSCLWQGVVYANTNGFPVFSNSGGNNQWQLRANWLASGDNLGSQTANAAALLMYETAFSAVGAAAAFTYGKPFAMLGVRDGTTAKLFIDGRLAATATVTQRNVSGATAHQIGISGWKTDKYTSIGAWGAVTSTYDSSALTHMAAFWARALTDGEASEISGDPYCLVEPA